MIHHFYTFLSIWKLSNRKISILSSLIADMWQIYQQSVPGMRCVNFTKSPSILRWHVSRKGESSISVANLINLSEYAIWKLINAKEESYVVSMIKTGSACSLKRSAICQYIRHTAWQKRIMRFASWLKITTSCYRIEFLYFKCSKENFCNVFFNRIFMHLLC